MTLIEKPEAGAACEAQGADAGRSAQPVSTFSNCSIAGASPACDVCYMRRAGAAGRRPKWRHRPDREVMSGKTIEFACAIPRHKFGETAVTAWVTAPRVATYVITCAKAIR